MVIGSCIKQRGALRWGACAKQCIASAPWLSHFCPMTTVASGSSSRSQSSRQAGPSAPNVPSYPNSNPYEKTLEEHAVPPVPLKLVVADAVKRWFEDTYQDAQRGDVKQQALLGQMYAEGYGCEKNMRAAREWSEKAGSRGYQMRGVYCEL